MRSLLRAWRNPVAIFGLMSLGVMAGLLLLAQSGKAQGSKEQAKGTLSAILTVQFTHEATSDSGVTTTSLKETVDATFFLEVPDINYWKKPYEFNSFDFTFPSSESRQKEQPTSSRRKAPEAKVVSYTGTVRHSYLSQHWSLGGKCINKVIVEGGGMLDMNPGGGLGIMFKGDEAAQLMLTSKEYTLTTLMEDSPGCPKPGKGTGSKQHNFPVIFPMSALSGLPQGWSGQLSRTPKGITGIASYRQSKNGVEDRITVSFMLNTSAEEEVEAVPGGPYEVIRGQSLTLDGSRSKGKNLKYEWTFAPKKCPDGAVGNKGARKEGVRPTVILLCDTRITLKVADGKNTDTKTVLAVVTARNWKTRVHNQIDAYLQAVGLCRPETQFGRNVCALDGASAFEGEQKTGHFFHKKPDQIGWEKTGYILGRVSDRNGPFDGWWYVKENLLSIQRAALINRDLNEQSALYEENRNRGYQRDFDTLIDQVKTHERIHSTLIEEALSQNDPAKIIEAMFHPHDKDALIRRIDIEIIQKADESLRKATGDDNVKERLKKLKRFNRAGKVLLKVCNTERYEIFTIGSFALIGD